MTHEAIPSIDNSAIDRTLRRKTGTPSSFIGKLRSFFAMPVTSIREPALDGIRGLAVVLTFCVHFAGAYLVKYRGGNPDIVTMGNWEEPFDKFFYWIYHSHHGVHFFFALSGFLIGRMVLKTESFSYWPFFVKRLKRIYPPFLFSLVICIALPMIALGRDFPSTYQLVGNIVFLNALPQTGVVGIPFNNVTWSLFFEFIFYFSFPALVYVIRRFEVNNVFGLIVGGLGLAYLPFFFGIYQTDVFLLFFAGTFIGLVSGETGRFVSSQIPDSLLAALYLSATTMHTFGIIDGGRFLWIFAITAALVILKAAYGEGWLTRSLSFRPVVWLGEISYSFYLVHSISLAVMFAAAPFVVPGRVSSDHPLLHALVLALFGFLASVLLAVISFALFERSYFGEKRRHLTITERAP